MSLKLEINTFLSHLTDQPGVYQMLDAEGEVIYVGKARNLKKRVSQYFRAQLTDAKTIALMQQVEDIKIIITRNEIDALLLESNLIKAKRPRYNILLKDDKTYPYLFLSAGNFPRLDFYRGNQSRKGRYFGPYTNSSEVRKTLGLLQKLFKIRQCNDTFFKNRARPCLQYHINRCTAPCVNYINAEEYGHQVQDAILFLEGKNDQLIKQLESRMEEAAKKLDYEKAALFRDQIASLRRIQQKQYIVGSSGDFDIIAVIKKADKTCVGVLRIRGGHLLGSHEYFPKIPPETSLDESLMGFLSQYYLGSEQVGHLPRHIALNIPLKEKTWMESALSEKAGNRISITHPKRGKQREWVELIEENVNYALDNKLVSRASYAQQLTELSQVLHLKNLPKRIECFDISHTSGESTVASCVVFGIEGPIKSEYRRFNIKDVKPGDDYAAMAQVLMRRYQHLKKEEAVVPDVILIDGGKGQLNIAGEILNQVGVEAVLLGISKGEGRKAQLDTLWLWGKVQPIVLDSSSVAKHLLQHVRDEAHRFAILGHRKKRDKKRSKSVLESISGIGVKKRRALLNHFGGLQALKSAGVDEIANVSGIGITLAQHIYEGLHK